MIERIFELANKLGELASKKNIQISTAESCTGGMLASYITSASGSSNYFDRGYITYSNRSKIEELDIDEKILEKFGAVSPETAKAMAAGCLAQSKCDIALSITGIAGPTGGSHKKPVGTVYISIATHYYIASHTFKFTGNREQIRIQTCLESLNLLIGLLQDS